MTKITFSVNGEKRTMEVDEKKALLDVLRDDLGLTSVKHGCGVGECGACAVLIDGKSFNSCIYLAVWADGKNIRTAESLTKDGKLSNLQEAFVEEGAVQCGFCTPGILMSATELEESGEHFTREEIKKALSGHLCRCTGYKKIVDATEKVLNKDNEE